MCFGPELALLALSAAASAGGGMIANNEAQSNAKRIQAARNNELQFVLAKQRKLEEANRLRFDQNIDKFDKPNQEKAQQDAVDLRNTEVAANAPSVSAQAGDIPLSGNTPKIISGGIANRMKEAFDAATSRAKAVSKLGTYGDVFNQNGRNIMDLGRNIDTENGFSRAWAGLLPSLQDLAGSSADKPSSGIGQLLSGVGQIGAGVAGSGLIGGAKPKVLWDPTNTFLTKQPVSI
jgi:hypothetical protein